MLPNLPEGMTEDEALSIIDRQVNRLAKKFVFGCFTKEDVFQQGRLFAVRGMAKYDPSRPLANFVYAHVKNRLINLLRDKVRRTKPPCDCHSGRYCHGDKPCRIYRNWKIRNDRKAAIAQAPAVCTGPEGVARPACSAELKDIRETIDKHLPSHLRADYLRMLDGAKVGAVRRRAVEDFIRGLFHEEE